MAMPRSCRHARFCTADQHRTLVRPIDAGQDLDQRALAGAVLAADAADFTGADVERHVLERGNGAEAL
jgi:hypothetical protein